jgi:dolichyl-diphosphooligosaccharide--protein glycosyltransferase
MSPRSLKPSSTNVALFGISALALALRLLGAEQVFRGQDVIFRGYDSYYHVRRALYSLLHFPAVLERDPLLNYPFGSAVPWPPLYDALIAAVAKLLGGDEATLEHVAALAPPLLGALSVIPAYFVGRRLGGRGVGLVAALFVATLDAHVAASRVGLADHHAAAALLGMLLLQATLAVADRRSASPGGAWIGLVAARVALVLAIPGSVIPLAVSETGLITATVLEPDARRRGRLRRAGMVSALAAAGLLLPFAWTAATTADYGVNPNYFTTFHPLLFACIAALHALLGFFERGFGPASASVRLARLIGCGAGLALLLTAASADLRSGLEYGLRFLSGTHSAGDRVLEERPLLAFHGRLDPTQALRLFGLASVLLPLVPIYLFRALRDRPLRPALGIFSAWFLFFAALSLSAVRFANEFAGAAAVGLALVALAVARAAPPRLMRLPGAIRAALGVAVFIALLGPVAWIHKGRALRLFRSVSGAAQPARTLETSMYRFAQQVRAATPETRGFLDPSEVPEYGIFTWSGIGHHLHYVARRATVADNFGPVTGLDDRNFMLSDQLFRYQAPVRALRTLRRLNTPYIVTTDFGWKDAEVFLNRLHRDDAAAREGRRAIPQLRLLAESPPRGSRGSRFKLFQLVEGAALRFDAPAGTPVEVRVALRTNAGRALVWSNRGIAGPNDRARLRIPYPSGRSLAPTHAIGPVELITRTGAYTVEIRESDVREGSEIEVPTESAPSAEGNGALP